MTALVCTPDMPGVEIFQKNRSKCGIRGTWQARIRFRDVKVPRSNLLHQEGKGLHVALSCLNYGRCTLSAGMLGGASPRLRAVDQVGADPLPVPAPAGGFRAGAGEDRPHGRATPTRWTPCST